MFKHFYISGNPNAGKTSFFNQICGTHLKTGNYDGVTTSIQQKTIEYNTKSFTFYDLPGTYSLQPRSEDEKVATEKIKNIQQNSLVVYIAPLQNLRQDLLLFYQIKNLGLPIILVLQESKHNSIDVEQLSKALGIPVFFQKNVQKIDSFLKAIFKKNTKTDTAHPSKEMGYLSIYQNIDRVLKVSQYQQDQQNNTLQDSLHKLSTHPILGIVLFCIVLLGLFQLLFTFSDYPIAFIEYSFEKTSLLSAHLFENHWFSRLLSQAIIPGIAGVVVFIPQIAFLFFILEWLSQSGYLPRASFLMNGLFTKIGLTGNAMIPMVSAHACAVPAIMATRTIADPKKRLISNLVIPFLSCSARLPVYVLLITLVIPSGLFLGLSYKSWALFLLYFLSIFTTALAAFILSKTVTPISTSPQKNITQLPALRWPEIYKVCVVVFTQCKRFVLEAGKYIFFASIILWFLASNGPNMSFYKTSEPQIEHSYLAIAGKAIEPVIKPLGYNWKIGVGIISSFAAREVFVGSMAAIYGMSDENEQGLIHAMRQDVFEDGSSVYSLATGMSLLVFYALALQCISTIAVVKKETKTFKWPLLQFLGMTTLAIFCAKITYVLFS